VPKGKSLGEIEADEGGVVKESLVGMAQTKRAAQRKQTRIEGAHPAPRLRRASVCCQGCLLLQYAPSTPPWLPRCCSCRYAWGGSSERASAAASALPQPCRWWSLEQAPPAKHTEALAERTEAPAADTELVGDADLEAVEERLQAPADGGVALEPFNLEQERAEGFFDEEGHYVEKKDEEERDAWLASGEGARRRRRLFAAELTGIPAGRPYGACSDQGASQPCRKQSQCCLCSAWRCARRRQRHARLCAPSRGADQAPRARAAQRRWSASACAARSPSASAQWRPRRPRRK